MILTPRLKEVTAATVGPKLGTGTRGQQETATETKNCTQEKASCWHRNHNK